MIGKEITKVFQDLYTEENNHRPFIERIECEPITLLQAKRMERLFEEDEIKRAVWDLAGMRHLENLEFFKNCWKVVKENLIKVFAKF